MSEPNPLPQDTQEHSVWNEELSRKYDFDAYHESSWLPIRWVESRRVREVIQALGPITSETKVLEVGCGPGMVLSRITQGRLYGIDLSEHLVEQARERLGLRADIEHGNAESIPFENDCFDSVFCTEVLEHTLHPDLVVQECLRVLKPGGRMVLTVPNEALIDFFKKFVRLLGIGNRLKYAGPDGSEGRFGHEWHLHHLTGKQVVEWAKQAGAVGIRHRRLPFFLLPFHHQISARKP